MKKIFLTIALSVIEMTAVAQTVNVHFKNGQKVQFNSANVDFVDFSEKAPDPTLTAGKAVDLGLSVYWASCNLGAEKPEEYGGYYAWGETKEKSSYTKNNYSYYDKDKAQYIDIGNNISGTEYDAATVNLGSDWRMPTDEETNELIKKCTWEWTQINGRNGFKVTGTNGNSIFIPAGGYYLTSNLRDDYMYIWNSTKTVSGENCVCVCGSSSTKPFACSITFFYGMPIRPVTSNPNAGGDSTDHSQDYLVTDKVTASFLGGAYTTINGKIQSGSQLNVKFSNGSSESVTLVKIQLGDAATGSEGNNMLNEEIDVNAGESKSYTVTVGASGITTPVIRFSYRYNKKVYIAEATWIYN